MISYLDPMGSSYGFFLRAKTGGYFCNIPSSFMSFSTSSIEKQIGLRHLDPA